MNGTVTITDPRGRQIYVNGNYTPGRRMVAPCTFTVEYGRNTFETLNGNDEADYSATVYTNQMNPTSRVALRPTGRR